MNYSLAAPLLQDPQRSTLNRAFADRCCGHRHIAARWRDPISRSPPSMTKARCAYAVQQRILPNLCVAKEAIVQFFFFF
jgi:hypothetical protein